MPSNKTDKKMPKGRVMYADFNWCDMAGRDAAKLFTKPNPASHPVAVIPCKSVKQARALVKMHAGNLPTLVRANLKAKCYTNVGCDLVLRHMADALNMPELAP